MPFLISVSLTVNGHSLSWAAKMRFLPKLYVVPSWPILLTLRKFRQIFLKIKPPGPPVWDMPRHKLVVIKLLITAKEPVETVS